MNSLSLLLKRVPVYHLAIEQKGQRQGRPWKNKNITQTLSWHVRLKLLRRKIRVSNDHMQISVSKRKKKKRKLSSYQSRFEGRASIFFCFIAFTAVAI